MKQAKQDRRSQRSRQLVNSALMQLLVEKRYEEITVQDIVERAGVGRSTFYAHYYDKEDVQSSLMQEILERFKEELAERTSGQGIVPGLELLLCLQCCKLSAPASIFITSSLAGSTLNTTLTAPRSTSTRLTKARINSR